MTFRFLGTGTSVGVPQIGCTCPVCTSSDPRDRRNRCGAYVSTDDAAFLIDTPPELREACLAFGVSRVDAVLLTHAHMDHVAGFDDIRRFNTINGTWVPCAPTDEGANGRTTRCLGKILPCYVLRETEEQMHKIFPYISTKGGEHGLYRPMVEFRNEDSFAVGGVRVERLRVEHGFPCCGYLLRETGGSSCAYVSDCHVIPDDALERLAGVDTLVINCLRERPHPTHLTLSEALSYVARIAPRRAYLTHMCHDLSHEAYLARLKGTNVLPAYDGLELTI